MHTFGQAMIDATARHLGKGQQSSCSGSPTPGLTENSEKPNATFSARPITREFRATHMSLIEDIGSPQIAKQILRVNKAEMKTITTTLRSRALSCRASTAIHSSRDANASFKIRKLASRGGRRITSIDSTEDLDLAEDASPKKRIQEPLPEKIKIYWTVLKRRDGWIPATREATSMTRMGRKILMSGGKNSEMLNDVLLFDTMTHKWAKIKPQEEMRQYFGHASVKIGKSEMLIYGGESKDLLAQKQFHSVCNDVVIINTDRQTVSRRKYKGGKVKPRKYHIAAAIGRKLIIHGGIDDTGTIIGQSATYSVKKKQWSIFKGYGDEPEPLAYHTCCLVFYREQLESKDFRLFSIPYCNSSRYPVQARILENGIYVFGGLNKKRQSNNTLRILKVDDHPFKWIEPQTKGRTPVARYQHSMSTINSANIVAICGGRVDIEGRTSSYKYISTVDVLNLDTLTWAAVQVFGTPPKPRGNHAAESFGHNLVIFGGINKGRFTNSTTYMCDFKQKSVEARIEQDEEERMSPTWDMNKARQAFESPGLYQPTRKNTRIAFNF